MDRADRECPLWPLLCALRRQALEERQVPDSAVSAATRAVSGRFSEYAQVPLDPATKRRVVAYFWGAARRHALRADPGYARRIVRATVVADLEEAGWDRRAIGAELRRAGLSA